MSVVTSFSPHERRPDLRRRHALQCGERRSPAEHHQPPARYASVRGAIRRYLGARSVGRRSGPGLPARASERPARSVTRRHTTSWSSPATPNTSRPAPDRTVPRRRWVQQPALCRRTHRRTSRDQTALQGPGEQVYQWHEFVDDEPIVRGKYYHLHAEFDVEPNRGIQAASRFGWTKSRSSITRDISATALVSIGRQTSIVQEAPETIAVNYRDMSLDGDIGVEIYGTKNNDKIDPEPPRAWSAENDHARRYHLRVRRAQTK